MSAPSCPIQLLFFQEQAIDCRHIGILGLISFHNPVAAIIVSNENHIIVVLRGWVGCQVTLKIIFRVFPDYRGPYLSYAN
jgi:hypothetical protein